MLCMFLTNNPKLKILLNTIRSEFNPSTNNSKLLNNNNNLFTITNTILCHILTQYLLSRGKWFSISNLCHFWTKNHLHSWMPRRRWRKSVNVRWSATTSLSLLELCPFSKTYSSFSLWVHGVTSVYLMMMVLQQLLW
jgi:hypothetical protein